MRPSGQSWLRKQAGLDNVNETRGEFGMTRPEIAAAFGVTPQRIAQIEAKALRKLRRIPRELTRSGAVW